MNVPVTLPVVRIDFDETGTPTITVDNQPYSTEAPLTRDTIPQVLDDLARDLGTAVRVEVVEKDGSTYVDIVTPNLRSVEDPDAVPANPSASDTATASDPSSSVTGHGFRPGEQVTIAYVLASQPADDDGSTRLRLPPALLAHPMDLLMVGLESGTTATATSVS